MNNVWDSKLDSKLLQLLLLLLAVYENADGGDAVAVAAAAANPGDDSDCEDGCYSLKEVIVHDDGGDD